MIYTGFVILQLLAVAIARPPNERIIGGKPATLGQFPYQVSVQRPTDGGPEHFCGGSILNENWIVTAAHCCKGHAVSNLTIIAGSLSIYPSNNDTKVQIRKGLKNEIFFDYELNSLMYDICLVQVTEPFVLNTYIQKVSIPKQMQNTSENATGVVSGWGYTTYENGTGELSKDLMWVELPIISDKTCEDLYFPLHYDTDPSMICTCVMEGGKDACKGDSGGPLVVNNTLIGIVSWGYECARPKTPGVYTEVAYYADWINSWINKTLSV